MGQLESWSPPRCIGGGGTPPPEMEGAAEALDFERAASLRDRIRAMASVQTHQDINVEGVSDADCGPRLQRVADESDDASARVLALPWQRSEPRERGWTSYSAPYSFLASFCNTILYFTRYSYPAPEG